LLQGPEVPVGSGGAVPRLAAARSVV